MTRTLDWIVVGGGITGAAVSYELARQGLSVLLLEQHAPLQGATRFSYGGLAFWAGTTPLTRQLYQEGIQRHRDLSQELGFDTQFRELDLLLTIATDDDPVAVQSLYQTVEIVPQLLSVEAACQREPLLNPAALSGALIVRHGHICPLSITQAYCQAFLQQGGTLEIDTVIDLISSGNRVIGAQTTAQTYYGANILICAGGLSRRLLAQMGISLPLYFTHAEILETEPLAPSTDIQLQTMVMPARQQRGELEAMASSEAVGAYWHQLGQELAPPILDPGVVQFQDSHCCIGQISRALTDPNTPLNFAESEANLRQGIGHILPKLRELPATWHHCVVAFSRDHLPFIGEIQPGLSIFSGFSTPLVMIPPLAQRFAASVAGNPDPILPQFSPTRFDHATP